MDKGYVQVYTGGGKGKTTAMLGLALRACGAGMRVYIGQFIKDMEYNEVKAIREFLPNVVIEQYGPGFLCKREPEPLDKEVTSRGFEKTREAVFSGKYELVMLDEINMALYLRLIPVERVLELIHRKPIGVELVLTGRNAPQEIIDAADLVTDMQEIKHYYSSGILARDGIER